MLNVQDIKKDFPIFKTNPGLVYLDSAASSQKPQIVIDIERKFYEESYANVHRGIYDLSMKATDLYEGAREKVRKFVNAASTKEIIFVRGATEAINLVASSYGATLKAGDVILLSEMEHHANVVPWQKLRDDCGITLRWIPVTADGQLDVSNIDELLKDVQLVAVTHMSNVLGTVNDVQVLAQKAHAVGAKILVDGAQSVAHVPVDVRDLDCDFFVFSGHKMCGPTGIGVLYGKQEILERMEPYQRGGDMILEVTKEGATWNELPYKFEAGTPNIAGAIGLGAAVEYLHGIGMENIWSHEQVLVTYGMEQLKKIEGLKIFGDSIPSPSPTDSPLPNSEGGGEQSERGKGAIFAFTVDSVHPHDIGSILNDQHIAVRAGHHCTQPLHTKFGLVATTRASLYFYNTPEDIDALVKGILKVKEMFA